MDAFWNFLAVASVPASVVFLALRFETEIKSKFRDLKEIGVAGAKAAFADQNAPTPKDLSAPAVLTSLPAPPPTVSAIEGNLRAALADYKPDKHIDLLLRNLAQARVERGFEYIHSEIFDSQVKALIELRSAGGTIARAEAERYFEQVRTKFPDAFANTTFDQWFAFVRRNLLAEERNGEIVLTDVGRDFLDFVQAYKAGVIRPL